MPKKQIRELAEQYGYFRLKKYRKWDNVHFSAEVNGIVIVVNISSGELFERNPFTKRLVKKQKVR
ncbi:hypothetical protein [Enterococcus dongliensis]|uniref:hypothetical protein n=1 Tax=Enterococcus dongliensis TaxID=2559925 RepID=UPI0028929688|nr:hypothetical protein [Enterococcus dongliensis]MDT2613116.1 hypothetical protein [Enterococcus dongliensis]